MSVSLKWGLACGRLASVPRGMLTAMALSAAVSLPARSMEAASFEESDQTASVLLSDPTAATVASPIAPAEAGNDSKDSLLFGSSAYPVYTATGCTAEVDKPCSCSECLDDEGVINRACSQRRGRMVDCDPPGLLQKIGRLYEKSSVCWSGRADLLLLWRNAPPSQALIVDNQTGSTALNANQLDSELAAGPRFSLFRTDTCGHGWEATYFRAFNFHGQETMPATAGSYGLPLPNAAGYDTISTNLGSGIQSFELNRYERVTTNIRLLAGFRWVEWRESATLTGTQSTGVVDIVQSDLMNSMYGGQIGFEALVLTTNWLRVESVMKGGAYGNNVARNSLAIVPDLAINQTAHASQNPASCGFVGELGFTGVIPIDDCIDFRFGYVGLWLEGIGQPTQQLGAASTDQIVTTGGTVVQGLSLGLEGRW